MDALLFGHKSCFKEVVMLNHLHMNLDRDSFMARRSARDFSKNDHLNAIEKNLRRTNRHLLKKTMHTSGGFLVQFFCRAAEIVISVTSLCFLGIPILLYLAIRKSISGQKILVNEIITGIGGQPIVVNFFNLGWKPAAGIALLFSVVKGDLTFVGASFVKYAPSKSELENNYLHTLKPGLFSLWELRSNCKLGHEGHKETEWEYCFTKNNFSDAFIALRSIPAYFMRSSAPEDPSSVTIFDVVFANLTMVEAVARIEADLALKSGLHSIFYVNADCLNKSYTDHRYAKLLKKADYVLPDGIGINLACRILGTSMKENVNGTDMLPFLCDMAARKGHSIFLLGGMSGVAERMAEEIKELYGVTIAGVRHGYFDHQAGSQEVVNLVNNSGADILLVAFGAPLQEEWITTHKSRLRVGVALGVGGLFDFYSGNTQRAPRWFRELGLEWVYRMIQEPGRMWRRYVIGNPLFLYRVVGWRANRKSTVGE